MLLIACSSVKNTRSLDISTRHVHPHFVTEKRPDQLSGFATLLRTEPVKVRVQSDLSFDPNWRTSVGFGRDVRRDGRRDVPAVQCRVIHRLIQVEADLVVDERDPR